MSNPFLLILNKKEKFKDLYRRLDRATQLIVSDYHTKLFQLQNSYVLTNPSVLYIHKEHQFNNLVNKLKVLNPLDTLKRGYSIVRLKDRVVSDSISLKAGDVIQIEFRDGIVKSKVEKVGD